MLYTVYKIEFNTLNYIKKLNKQIVKIKILEMKTIFTLLVFMVALTFSINAQNVKKPLAPKVKNEIISTPPGEEWSWVKGHWDWNSVKYAWKRGMYVQKKEGYSWVDGDWERDNKSGWWKMNDGYWKKDAEFSDVDNDKNTKDKDKAAKAKRKKNKSKGMFIKTGDIN